MKYDEFKNILNKKIDEVKSKKISNTIHESIRK